MFGVLAIDKPAGLTSRDVVNRIERLVRPYKVGHTGTLDPLATGVLLLAVGRATRLVEFSHGHDKAYEAEFLLGRRSDTLDTEGQVELLPDAPLPSRADLQQATRQWLGEVQQVPPKFSALNVNGRRAHDLARQGVSFELPARTVHIHRLEIVAYAPPDLTIRVECGSGTYIRSLGSDLARCLGSDAVMSRLRRTRIGPFELDHCQQLQDLTSSARIAAQLQPAQWLLANMPHIELTSEEAEHIRNGRPLQFPTNHPPRLAALDAAQQLVAVLQQTPSTSDSNDTTPHAIYRSLRVFHHTSETDQPSSSSMQHKPES
ncbi:MAG: tRNA pseudouridine(55) synthase TruB [Planctomycetales bacterium]|nr:tRNA pseudouridine(55) synthase TruB [Planctomycetales bacterium]